MDAQELDEHTTAPGVRPAITYSSSNDHRAGVTNGDRGIVTHVDEHAQSLRIRVGDRDVWLDHDFLASATEHGQPVLQHGYAITGHVAQGLTVDRTFVLADAAIDREWAYVALSRGRHSNQLYLPEQRDDDRAEIAPTSRPASDAIDRLAAQLNRSRAQVLAIDSGRAATTDIDAATDRVRATEDALRAAQERFRDAQSIPGTGALIA
jgi:hypothetical protein